ncbi:hypothetical protein GQ43DRAFT_53082 [Delitschia confertaspora ATCC 74209]|uniref:CCR4-Not complex 3'-5'-exoribonuclease subunit Ccr4 n=1 Tax=Delitschia confertaspora ATCC 74209 TaxID=1513339 RepID=A0A9P4JMH0_9PLEO|nr:hypothetical protein GQ43DRAFT_53082 [Delitschia confertaspora ATCC 74209]
MADGYPPYQRGPGQNFYSQQHTQNYHARNLPSRVRSPTTSGRIGFTTDTPSPSRSPAPQSPHQYGMFNQGHQHQGHGVMMNGGTSHQRYAAMQQLNLGKTFQQQPHHQHQTHPHQQHQQDLHGTNHGGQYGNHQHTISSGNMSNATPHFAPSHLQNGTPGSAHSGLSKAPNEHWAEQLQLAQQAREMSQSHAHARNHPSVNKNVVAGTNGIQKEADKEERNRPVAEQGQDSSEKHIWTALDFGGQRLKLITNALFRYTFLTKLYLNYNKLTYIPPAIGRLRNLVHLDLSVNELRDLPPEMGMLVNMKQLLLFDNNLETLPYELGSMYQLEMLGIEGNPLQEGMKSIIVEQGTTKLIEYLRENAPGPDPPPEREWLDFTDLSDPPQETVTALSYNILCDKYCTPSQYGYTPSGALKWTHRREVILAELRAHNADVVCLQEIDQESFNDYFRAMLAHDDYKGVFWPKGRARTMGEKEANQVDGCAIFYKNTKYILLDKQLIDFANTAINRPDMKGEHDIFNRVMPRDDIAVVAFLENRATGSRLIVVNAHVFWNPKFTDVKLVQVAILMEQIKKLADRYVKWPACKDKKMYWNANGEGEDSQKVTEAAQEFGPSLEYSDVAQIPMLMCGDFNSMPNSGVYDLIAHGNVSNSHADLGTRKYGNFTRDGISHPFTLKSSYAPIGELSFTNYTPGFTGVLDYIWYSTNTLQVAGLLGDVDKEYLQRVPGFPNYHFPSDHLALYVKYAVKGRKEKKITETDFGQGNNQRDRDRDRR